jgi:uncharacterized membrane protein
MKCIKWKILIITCFVGLLPIFLGLAVWDSLPEKMAIHFNFYNEPDNFASKGFAVFGLPLIMTLLQIFCCIMSDINAQKYARKHFTKWQIPIVSIILQIVILGYGLGWNIDMRKVAAVIVIIIFLVSGIYIPWFKRNNKK